MMPLLRKLFFWDAPAQDACLGLAPYNGVNDGC